MSLTEKLALVQSFINNRTGQASAWAVKNPRKFVLGAGLAVAGAFLVVGHASAASTLDGIVRLFGNYVVKDVRCISGGQDLGSVDGYTTKSFDGGKEITIPGYQFDNCQEYSIHTDNKNIGVSDSQIAGADGRLDIGQPVYESNDFTTWSVAIGIAGATIIGLLWLKYRGLRPRF